MLDLIAAEHDLLARLRERMGEVPARAFPATNGNGDLPMLKNDAGEVYVRWLGDALGAPAANRSQVIEQTPTSQWETFVRCKSHAAPNSNPHHVGYALVMQTVQALSGFTLPSALDGSVLYPVRRQFMGEVEGLWNFSIIWQFTSQENTPMQADA